VFAIEGEGGLTPGAVHETLNSAWGLGLDNLYFLIDWNDFGIDDRPFSSVMYGTPETWFSAHGWRVFGTERGMEWEPVSRMFLEMQLTENPDQQPNAAWFKTRKGRGYGKFDNVSHGAPHAMDSEPFWATKREFAEKYGVEFANFGGPAPKDPAVRQQEFADNLQAVFSVLQKDPALVDYLAGTLVSLGESVPEEAPAVFALATGHPFDDGRLYDFRNYPADLYPAGASAANRAALAKGRGRMPSVPSTIVAAVPGRLGRPG
jgi:transketolase